MLLIDFFGLLFLKSIYYSYKGKSREIQFHEIFALHYLLLEDSEVGEESPSLDLV